MIIFWIIVFIISLAVLVKGADWLIASAEKIGLALGLSPFIVGVTIVGVGTSFPELISSFVAVFKGVPDVVAANAIGSNIANILLIVGVSAVIGRRLIVTKSLIDLDLPLLAISTVLLLGIVWDKQITFGESLLMLVTYGIYLLYTVLHKDTEDTDENAELLPSRQERRKNIIAHKKEEFIRPKLIAKDFILLVVGILGLVFGAKYLIDALVNLSTMLNIATGVIAITAVAVGTSLPELLVSVKAALQKKSEIALGNIFGSNVFNTLVVIGLPGLFRVLPVDNQIFTIGVPTMALATLLFVISGISRRIHMWEGAFYLSVYVLFVAKLFNWF
ncbi:calcium/sodium antiporter [Patescibacteria group bacterium]|nr:calcium/sodium antiporter [Patescibacteria group bacterium]MBU1663442.1 calcium/sodium antiporter [Patescibacteria group bacterium]MBU1933634.1 calcium/sodium antiporter [Patescibacteria group bacterium]MBU2007784.1 calcium/sodium antiporter [Patescibacteria group bacterium]MBU2233781.1 calcium/sodium antiporter [Patescibacteria group bacterium]